MDAIVLAGGYATRMWPITRNRPKMLLPVGDTTVIDKTLAQLEDDDEIEDIYISTNERFATDFDNYVEEQGYQKPELSVEDTSDEDEKFGVVGALAQLIDREELEDDLLIIAGDNMVGFDIADFVDFFEDKQSPVLAAYDVGDLERAKSYGLVELDGDEVVNFQEKPDEPNTTLASIACYAFPADVLPKFDTYLADDQNPDEPGWFLQWLQNRQSVHAFTFEDVWFDIGEAAAYLDAVDWKLGGEPLIADDATVENSELNGSTHVMSGATVKDSTVTDSLIFPDAHVEDAVLTDTVFDEKATIEGLDLSESLVGSYSQLSE
ncbi:glucose-1-phosphate thymidylyltransferase [Halohasta litchfieldiae]|jgi:glucose-1-phosphate thymidylyltransferase|uniref:Glucose-1-phosphate thymidylyltransferase n=1 Tax=Halohasta litchfieldiae TaxID=1073996 RepID=A0A1H6X5R6_9EURY|nr:NDP-sugar synthase [Halohasta litchfieldiae]ATW90055.1 glucose-1-phosphate thymidylyltransferase [Halohasta litchfieldiae]SEJ24509.1 glucose-1-phosphate thymidylyltransferase [Halohasta litchfieldiae]